MWSVQGLAECCLAANIMPAAETTVLLRQLSVTHPRLAMTCLDGHAVLRETAAVLGMLLLSCMVVALLQALIIPATKHTVHRTTYTDSCNRTGWRQV